MVRITAASRPARLLNGACTSLECSTSAGTDDLQELAQAVVGLPAVQGISHSAPRPNLHHNGRTFTTTASLPEFRNRR